MSDSPAHPVTRLIPAEATYPLRGTILRPGHPPSASVYPGDNASDTFHMGILLGETVTGIASFYSEPMPEAFAAIVRETNASLLEGHHWRLRGMAVDAQYQGQGYGKILLLAGIDHIAAQGGGWLWCNARTVAYGFYKGLGFQSWGEEFVIPDIGPHFVMAYRVAAKA